jgi:hypothetical protein
MSSIVVDLRLYPIDTSRKSASEGCMVIAERREEHGQL